jgi:5-methylcytosine-specific restriction endonuclease McrA
VSQVYPSNPFSTFSARLAILRELDAKADDRTDPLHLECDVRLFVMTTAAGIRQYTRRCLTCGKRTGKTAIGHAELTEDQRRGAMDKTVFAPRWRHYWDDQTARRSKTYDAIRGIRWQDGFYAVYIASTEWAAKRQEVMARARQGSAFPVCESCGVSPATEVHHLSYRRLGNEPLDDLMAVCGPCHQDIEAAKEEHRAELSYEE